MKKIKAKKSPTETRTERTPYMSRGIYKNYAKGMKEKNRQREKMGLDELYIRTFEEWSSQ